MMKKIQRFGGAMMAPVLLFAFTGIVVGIASLFTNPQVMGSIANEGTNWYKFWFVISEGGWTVFRQMPLLFAIGLPISLANKTNARACLEAFALYTTYNYFVAAMLAQWSFFGVDMSQEAGGTSGLAVIAGVKTLDTNLFGAIIISAIVVYLHNKYFDKKLPDFLGVFQGTVFVYIIGFLVMIPCAFITALCWPKVQIGINNLQQLLKVSGPIGVWIYTFLERALIPTGLHHFVYTPFIFGPAAVPGGIQTYWVQHISQFAQSTKPLKEMFPQGGFALHGNSKIFGSVGIALAMYSTAKPENKKKVAGLLLPVLLTAIVSGITEPLEFTFLFIAPVLFGLHAVLAATMSTLMYMFGVVGNFGGGFLDFMFLNWIPMFKNHSGTVITQIVIGLIFTCIYFILFRFLILKMDLKTPGREDEDEEMKLYTKADYKAKHGEDGAQGAAAIAGGDEYAQKGAIILEALGGRENIEEL
ncbi:MAG: alpha-glucoside-specific phosphotransferase enzyme IIB component, partial [Granulicatella sp.]